MDRLGENWRIGNVFKLSQFCWLQNEDVNRLKNRGELIFVSVHPSVPGLTTNTALEAIASSSGKNVKKKRLEGEI